MQQDIFSVLYEKYIIKKPIRLIELFGGYGSQYYSLKYLGANVEHWKLVEWAVPSIQAYKDGHCEDNNDYSKEITKEELIDYLFDKGISSNYNEPMSLQQIKRKNEQWLRTVYNNIIATKNLVNIQKVKGVDLEIVDTDKYDYIMTYSFPCQDLSLAGLGKGMGRESGTRSGMLWEVERILDEIKNENKELPQILLMENVPGVKGTNNVEHFNEWQQKLESLGYKNYHQNLIATDYGIPQTRNRTFMISILGDYSYTFPQPIPLKLKLKDMLEDVVDEKYYLSEKMISFFYKNEQVQKEKGNGFKFNVSNGDCVAKTVTTRAGGRMDDNFIAIPEATKKGYAEATGGDGVYINRPHQKRGVVQKDKIQTLKTSGSDVGVVVGSTQKNAAKNYDGLCPTLTSAMGSGGGQVPIHNYDLRIRKLTPRETFRLMGVKDEDYERIAKNQSNSSLYHLAGDSIVVNVLMAIFKELLRGD